MELKQLKYEFTVNVIKYFLRKYNDGEIKDLDSVVRHVKRNCCFVMNLSYIFDESVWLPNVPQSYKNLILFNIQLQNELEYLPIKLYIKSEQDIKN